MIYIAHRGNTVGKKPGLENRPDYLQLALMLGYQVEVDIWYECGWWLGHDKPQYKVTRKWIINHSYGCWYHAKNFNALNRLMSDGHVNEVFWHSDDKYVVTKGGHIWTFPGNNFSSLSIVNLKEKDLTPNKCYGICSDNVFQRRNKK